MVLGVLWGTGASLHREELLHRRQGCKTILEVMVQQNHTIFPLPQTHMGSNRLWRSMRWRVLPVALYCGGLLDQQPDRFHWLITIRLPLLFTDWLSKLSTRQPREWLVQLCYAAISETLQLPTVAKALRNQCSPALWLQEEPLKAWFPEPNVLLASLLAAAVNRPGKPSLTSSPEATHLWAGRFINVTFKYNCLYLQTRSVIFF